MLAHTYDMTATDIERWKIHFNCMDQDGNGDLTRTEFILGLKNIDDIAFHQILGTSRNDSNSKFLEVYDIIDKDGSGSISVEEFISHLSHIAAWAPLFNELDSDGSGSLTKQEFANGINKCNENNLNRILVLLEMPAKVTRSSKQKFLDIFDRMDSDHSGDITKMEFIDYLSDISSLNKLFRSLLRTGQKSLTKSEFAASITAHNDTYLVHVLEMLGMPTHSLRTRDAKARFLQIFEEMDNDESDNISRKEFVDYCMAKKKNCTRLSKNVEFPITDTSVPIVTLSEMECMAVDLSFDLVDLNNKGYVLKSMLIHKFKSAEYGPELVQLLRLEGIADLGHYLQTYLPDHSGVVSFADYKVFFRRHVELVKSTDAYAQSAAAAAAVPPQPPALHHNLSAVSLSSSLSSSSLSSSTGAAGLHQRHPRHQDSHALPPAPPNNPPRQFSTTTPAAQAQAQASSSSLSGWGVLSSLSRLVSSVSLTGSHAASKPGTRRLSAVRKKSEEIFHIIDTHTKGTINKADIKASLSSYQGQIVAITLHLPRYFDHSNDGESKLNKLMDKMHASHSSATEISLEEFCRYFE